MMFINKLLFIIEIMTAEILYTVYLKKRRQYGWRLIGSILAIIGLAVLLRMPDNNVLYSSAMFLCLFAVTIPFLKLCYDESWISLLFCGIAAYTTQHLAYMITNLLLSAIMREISPLLGLYGNDFTNFASMSKEMLLSLLMYCLCVYVTYCVCFFVFGKRIKKNNNLKMKSKKLLFIVGAGLILDIVLNSVFVYLSFSQEVIVHIIVCLYACMGCILLLVVQFEIVLSKQYEEECNFIKKLWYQDKEQYKLSKENIDVINLKCHDIKHQIREIGSGKSIPKEVVAEIENSISIYDTSIQTGNEVLDVILTEKNLRCYKANVRFSCIADGSAIAFMNDVDVYSLFGNAIDNALEATTKIKDAEKRVIGLTLRFVGRMVTLNINNSFEGELEFEKGLPKTTKEDKIFHGYGMKSIREIVRKYEGDMHISVDGSVFSLNILFPATKREKSDQKNNECV